MTVKWQTRAEAIHARFLKLAQDRGSLTNDKDVLHFLTLAICGEAGELANFVKKMWRGDHVDAADIRDEIADIRIYLEHLCRHLQIDLDSACEHKLDEVADRLTLKEAKESARKGCTCMALPSE